MTINFRGLELDIFDSIKCSSYFWLGESRGDGGRTCTEVLITNEHVQQGVKPAFISAERRPAAGPGTVQ